MSYIEIPNPRPKKFWHSPEFILTRIHRHPPSPEEVTATLEDVRVRHGVPTAVDRWISAGLTSAGPHACSAQAIMVPTLANLLEDLVECHLSTKQTEVKILIFS